MNAGDVFLIKNQYGVFHSFVVISDPKQLDDIRFPEYVFLVMLSSFETYKDDSCILRAGDHPSITHDTVVVYKVPPAIFRQLSSLEKLQEDGVLKKKAPVMPVVLEKLRQGYQTSRYCKDDIAQFLFRQGVID